MATRTISATGGNWNAVGAWVEGVVPTSADDVVALPAGASGALTINVAATCKSIDFTGYTNTLTWNAILTHAGNGTVAKFVAGMTLSGASTSNELFFTGTSGTNLLTTANLPLNVTQNGAGGTTQLQDAVNGASYALTNGTLDFNNKSGSLSNLNITNNSNTRVLKLAGATLTISVLWNIGATVTNFSFAVSDTGAITMTGDSKTFEGRGLTIPYTFSMTGLNPIINGANTFANLTITGTAVKSYRWIVATNQTVTGTLTITGNSTVNRIMVEAADFGNTGVPASSPTTLTAAVVSLTNVDFMDITAAGAAAPFTGTSIGDCGGNTSITADSPLTLYWFKDTGNFSDATKWFLATNGGGGSGRVPLPQDSVRFDANSFSAGSKTVTCDMQYFGASFDATGSTPSASTTFRSNVSLGYTYLFGSFNLASCTFDSGAIVIATRSNANVTMGGGSFYLNGLQTYALNSSTVSLQDAFVQSGGAGYVQHYCGTFATNGFSVTISGAFYCTGTVTRTLNFGASTITLTGSGSLWNISGSGLTLNAGTSTIICNNTSSSTKTWAGGGKTYNNFQITGSGTGAWTITGSNTFNDFRVDTPAKTVNFTASTTQTVTTFTCVGTSGNVLTLQSTSGGTAWNLSKSSGNVPCDYLSLQDSHASGGATWLAGPNSTNVSGNTGWIFGSYALPSVGAVAFTGGSTASQTSFNIPLAAVAITGQAPRLQTQVGMPSGAVIITPTTPALQTNTGVPTGSFGVSGTAPALQLNLRTSPGVTTLSGSLPSLFEDVGVPSGQLLIIGHLSLQLSPGAGSLLFSGVAPSMVPVGVLLFTGQLPTVEITQPTTLSRPRPLLHPRLRNVMPELWPSVCTIQAVEYVVTASNQRVPNGFSIVAGMRNIRCRLAPLIDDRPTDNEVRDLRELEEFMRRRCKLNGYFPLIIPREMQALVDGIVYPIRGVEHDSQHFSTRLMLEVILPHGG